MFPTKEGPRPQRNLQLTLENPWGHLWILPRMTPDDFTRQRGKCLGSLGLINNLLRSVNPGEPMGHLWILLCLTPDDFTRQREKCLGSLGLSNNIKLHLQARNIYVKRKMFTLIFYR